MIGTPGYADNPGRDYTFAIIAGMVVNPIAVLAMASLGRRPVRAL